MTRAYLLVRLLVFFKIPPSRVVVFHDELDLAPGKIRARTGGGVAGHNGLKSIASHFSQDFRRVRIGIGHPGERGLVTGHVLTDFADADMVWVDKTIEAIAEASPHMVADTDAEFASKVALILKHPGQKNLPEALNKTIKRAIDKWDLIAALLGCPTWVNRRFSMR